jgi:4-amino-4-deoxy-L-arabinose transferase-like glycosyltransferase
VLQVTNRQFEIAVVLLRYLSVALGLGVVLFTLLTFRELVPEAPHLAHAAAALVAFNPMFLFVHASVNNDCLLNFVAAAVVYGIVKTSSRPHTLWWAAGLGFALGLAALTKVSGLVLVPPTLLYLFLRRDTNRGALVHGGVLLLAIGGVTGWWFLRNHALYGSFTAAGVHAAIAGNGRVAVVPLALLYEWDGFVKSYWGVFGGFNIIYPDLVYEAFYAVSLLLIAFAGAGLFQRLRERRSAEFLFLTGLFATNLFAIMYWTSFLLGSQGRLLFPAIAASSVLAASGASRLSGPWQAGVFVPTIGVLLAGSGWAVLGLIPQSYLR